MIIRHALVMLHLLLTINSDRFTIYLLIFYIFIYLFIYLFNTSMSIGSLIDKWPRQVSNQYQEVARKTNCVKSSSLISEHNTYICGMGN